MLDGGEGPAIFGRWRAGDGCRARVEVADLVGPEPDGLVLFGTKGGTLRVSVWQPSGHRRDVPSAWTTSTFMISAM